MRDKFIFSNAQDLGSLANTGVKSTDWYDLEYDDSDVLIKADMMVECWVHINILTCTQTSGNEGLFIWVVESAATALTSPRHLGGILLLEAELVAGNMYNIGVSKQCTLRYMGIWYQAHTSTMNNATTIDAWMDDSPSTSPTYRCQKRPA